MEGETNLRNGFAISQHRLINQLAAGLVKTIANVAPEIKLNLTGKEDSNNTIKMATIASVKLTDEETKDELNRKVDQKMSELKNPFNLISLLGG